MLAMRLLCGPARESKGAANKVDLACDWLKMVWIGAYSITTQVVNFVFLANLPLEERPRYSMGGLDSSSVAEVDVPVSILLVDGSSPFPTTCKFVDCDLGKKAFAERNYMSHMIGIIT